MKKIFTVIACMACCLFMAMPAQAQLIKFGVKGGLNMSKLDIPGNWGEAKDNSTGFFIGPMAEITIPVIGLGVDGALMYSQRGDGEWKQQGLEVPVNLKYTFGLGSMLGLYIAAGPDFYFNFKDIDWENVESKNTQVALNLGAGLKLLKKLQVGVNYQIPMGDSFTFSEAVSAVKDLDAKTKTWQVSLAYIF